MENKDKEILRRLEEHYMGAKPGLDFRNAYELLVATILSAQCTDKRVNIVTADLFRMYPDAEALSGADIHELEEAIHSCGFYVVKARNLRAAASILVEKYGGEVPRTMEELVKLPGVGRKTANVVLSNAYGIPGLAVDTHVFRVSHRLALSDAKDPDGTEKQLCEKIPMEKWKDAHHWLIYHGRQVCSSQKPKCEGCFLKDICTYYKER
jgi:endonuclease-3